MSEPVRVELRQTTLTESAHLREADGNSFLAIENPPPVRSLLRITVGEEQRAFEVARVVEVIGEDEADRGCYGSFVELSRLEHYLKVGSEHLQPATGAGGVPAPVVIMNTNEMMLGEAGSDEDEAAASSPDDAPAEESSSEDAPAGEDAPADEPPAGEDAPAEDTPASEDAPAEDPPASE